MEIQRYITVDQHYHVCRVCGTAFITENPRKTLCREPECERRRYLEVKRAEKERDPERVNDRVRRHARVYVARRRLKRIMAGIQEPPGTCHRKRVRKRQLEAKAIKLMPSIVRAAQVFTANASRQGMSYEPAQSFAVGMLSEGLNTSIRRTRLLFERRPDLREMVGLTKLPSTGWFARAKKIARYEMKRAKEAAGF